MALLSALRSLCRLTLTAEWQKNYDYSAYYLACLTCKRPGWCSSCAQCREQTTCSAPCPQLRHKLTPLHTTKLCERRCCNYPVKNTCPVKNSYAPERHCLLDSGDWA